MAFLISCGFNCLPPVFSRSSTNFLSSRTRLEAASLRAARDSFRSTTADKDARSKVRLVRLGSCAYVRPFKGARMLRDDNLNKFEKNSFIASRRCCPSITSYRARSPSNKNRHWYIQEKWLNQKGLLLIRPTRATLVFWTRFTVLLSSTTSFICGKKKLLFWYIARKGESTMDFSISSTVLNEITSKSASDSSWVSVRWVVF